jgi:hypothetical protein
MLRRCSLLSGDVTRLDLFEYAIRDHVVVLDIVGRDCLKTEFLERIAKARS